mmetsp:Transcript_5904/g.14192  ORF Transcript_5904/g.14192 Transcript_5904/m.14192 type:complete len:600 (-) Transcript_5904:1459-3258(-)
MEEESRLVDIEGFEHPAEDPPPSVHEASPAPVSTSTARPRKKWDRPSRVSFQRRTPSPSVRSVANSTKVEIIGDVVDNISALFRRLSAAVLSNDVQAMKASIEGVFSLSSAILSPSGDHASTPSLLADAVRACHDCAADLLACADDDLPSRHRILEEYEGKLQGESGIVEEGMARKSLADDYSYTSAHYDLQRLVRSLAFAKSVALVQTARLGFASAISEMHEKELKRAEGMCSRAGLDAEAAALRSVLSLVDSKRQAEEDAREWEGRCKEVEASLRDERKAGRELKTRLGKTEEQLEEKVSEVHELNHVNTRTEEELAHLKQEVGDADSEVRSLRKALAEANARVKGMEETRKEMERFVGDQENMAVSALQRVSELVEKLGEAKAEVEDVRKEAATKVRGVKKELESAVDLAERAQREAQSWKERARKLEDRAHSFETERDSALAEKKVAEESFEQEVKRRREWEAVQQEVMQALGAGEEGRGAEEKAVKFLSALEVRIQSEEKARQEVRRLSALLSAEREARARAERLAITRLGSVTANVGSAGGGKEERREEEEEEEGTTRGSNGEDNVTPRSAMRKEGGGVKKHRNVRIADPTHM